MQLGGLQRLQVRGACHVAKLTGGPTERHVNRVNAKQFWAVADFVRRAAMRWAPANAGYELWRMTDADGQSWSTCMKLHVLPGPPARKGALQFKTSITLWPPDMSRQQQKRLAKLDWYDAIQQALASAGYSGKWSKSPFGIWGDFWKDVPNVAGVRKEAKRLEALELAPPKLRDRLPRGRGRRST